MADRWSKSLGEEFDVMMHNASIKEIDGAPNPMYIPDATPLKLLMYHMEKESKFTGFQALPGEVMDVYAAFRDYSIGMKKKTCTRVSSVRKQSRKHRKRASGRLL